MKHISIFLMLLIMGTTVQAKQYIDDATIQKTVAEIVKSSSIPMELITRGVKQTAFLWTAEDGDAKSFTTFCVSNFCKNENEKKTLFNRLCDNFEVIYGHNNRVTIELLRPLHVVGYDVLPVDELFGAYNGLSHFGDDMFNSKIAFIITLNFPFYSLDEKNQNADKWSGLEWGYARLGDIFTSRVPAKYLQEIGNATAAADNYISNYNIYMGRVVNDKNRKLFPQDMKLITHWGLRDELKSNYADKVNGTEKQKAIYTIMKRIIDQSIPDNVINTNEYDWNPVTNKLYNGNEEKTFATEPNTRYEYLLNIFKAMKEADPYSPNYPTYISRKFDEEFEISQQEVEKLFTQLLSSSQVQQVGKLISERLGRKLQPYDIWYDGFKSRSEINPEELDKKTIAKYPTKADFEKDLPVILQKLGFSKDRADYICKYITVDASIGAGHAWESMMRSDNAMLRTRIGENGMDYKGYNIGLHEFGHNVEQTISLHEVPNYFLRGVPNTAFTEALAFVFQKRDLDILGVTTSNDATKYLNVLDNFWGCYEIMGVALLDMKVWQWMYQNPDANPASLKEAVIRMAKEIWNQFYTPVFGMKDEPILAVYSHMIDAPLYLSAYPLGHLVEFQLENYLEGKVLGAEVEKIFSNGRLTPQYWMQKGLNTELSVTPLLNATGNAIVQLKEIEKKAKKK